MAYNSSPVRVQSGGRGASASAIAVVLVVAIWIAIVGARLAGDVVVPWDSKNQFYAFFRFLAESLHSGASPFWNPYHYGGHPSIADPQSMLFTPGYLIWAWFDRTPSMLAMDLIEWVHLLIGALAVALWGGRRGWPAPPAIAAAIIFALGGATSARLNHVGIIVVYAAFPVALLALEVALERRSVLLGLVAGAVVATIIAGRNQVSLLLAILLAAWLIAEIVRSGRPLDYARERAWVMAAMALACLMLAAIPVLLTSQFAAHSNRPDSTLATALLGSFYPGNLASMFAPNVFGVHASIGAYWGPDGVRLPAAGSTDDSFNYFYFGVVPTLLLGWFGVAGRLCGRQGSRLLAGVLVLSLLFALGRYTPVFPLLFDHVPGVSYFRRPVDGLFVFGIALALMTGQFLAAYKSDGLPRLSLFGTLSVGIVVIAVIVEAVSFSATSGNGINAAKEIAKSLALAGIVIAGLWLGDRHGRREWALVAVSAIAVAELLSWNAISRLNGEGRAYYQVLETATAEDAEAIAILTRELERRHKEGARPRVEIVGLGGAWQNIPVVRKFEATNGYNPLRIGAYDRFVAPGEMSYQAEQREFPQSFTGYDCALARALGLEYIVLDRPIDKVAGSRLAARATPLKEGPGIWIYRLPPSTPRVVFNGHVRVADVDAIGLFGELDNPPSDDVITLDDQTPPMLLASGQGRNKRAGSARVASWRPGRIEVEVVASGPGVLVLHDTHYPGWVVEVDGRPARLLRADVLFRAVEVGAGRHRVEFRYEPLGMANLMDAAASLVRRR